jgi:hypothetical protein
MSAAAAGIGTLAVKYGQHRDYYNNFSSKSQSDFCVFHKNSGFCGKNYFYLHRFRPPIFIGAMHAVVLSAIFYYFYS